METMNKNKLPTPEQRPELYDDFDCTDRKLGEPTGVKTPDHIQKLIDERAAKKTPAKE